MSTKITTEEFINKAILKHGERYDYSVSEYNGVKKKVKIICKDHGEFLQSPDDHINGGKNCPKCRLSWVNLDDFILQCNKKHNNKYNYDKITHINRDEKILIICPKHGEFYQLAKNHYKGHGCVECGGRKELTTEAFIKKAKQIHGDTYDYCKTRYNKKEKIEIICHKHGSFFQTPNNHLRYHGCPSCSNMRSNKEIKWLDSLNNKNIERQVSLQVVGGERIIADGYDKTTNTIYEFWGDFWHGNPKTTDHKKLNPRTKKTFGEHYQKTLNKIKTIKESKYNLIEMWESDFK